MRGAYRCEKAEALGLFAPGVFCVGNERPTIRYSLSGPHECDGLEAVTEHERVAAQVFWLNRRLDNSACSAKMLTIHYEQLCENPEREVERIRNWCNEKGVAVERKFELPKQFPFKRSDLNADTDAIKIREALSKLEAKHGKLEVAQ